VGRAEFNQQSDGPGVVVGMSLDAVLQTIEPHACVAAFPLPEEETGERRYVAYLCLRLAGQRLALVVGRFENGSGLLCIGSHGRLALVELREQEMVTDLIKNVSGLGAGQVFGADLDAVNASSLLLFTRPFGAFLGVSSYIGATGGGAGATGTIQTTRL